MRRTSAARLLALLALSAALIATAASAPGAVAATGALPSGFQDTIVLPGLNQPTTLRFSPDGRIFVATKGGEILVYDSFADTEPTVFADLREQVYDNGDRGLLGLELDPDFPARPYVYALFTFDHLPGPLGDASGAYPHWNHVPPYEGDPCPKPENADVDACAVNGRLLKLTADGDIAVAEEPLIEDWCQQFSSHSVGDLAFGPEGALFASGGDGASFTSPDYGQFGWPDKNQCGDPPGVAGQELTPPFAEGGALRALDVLTPDDPTGLGGSVIRIDPDTGAGLPDNPFAFSPDENARRIVAFGFRNPFRFAIDRQRGEIYVGNVGNATYEEIDSFPLVPEQAHDSGWPCFEGPDPEPAFRNLGLNLCEGLYDVPDSTAQPLLYFPHAAGVTPDDQCPHQNGSAISGSSIYEGDAYPDEYDGALFFADSVRGCIYVMLADDDGELEPSSTRPFLSDGGPYTGADIQEGPEGNLYYLSLYGDESVHQIFYDPNAPVAKMTSDKQWGPNPLTVHFDASASTDPQSEDLTFNWDLDGDGTYEMLDAGSTVSETFTQAVNETIAVQVEDEAGSTSVAQRVIYPGDTPPQVDIESPGPGLSWSVGQRIEFHGSAVTEEGNGDPIPFFGLYWRTSIFHCPGGSTACHAHPLQVFNSTPEGSFVAPEHDFPSLIQITFTATDSRGLAKTKTVEIQPRTVSLRLASEPPGVSLTAGTVTRPGPFDLTAIEGGHISLAAPPTAEIDGEVVSFKRWSDGGARVHSILADGSRSYTAIYVEPATSPPPDEAPQVTTPKKPGRPSFLRRPPQRIDKRATTFAFKLPGKGVTYSCKLDRAPFRGCRSPRTLHGLKPGRHTFKVRASVAGMTGKPASYTWTVLAR